MKKNSFLLFAFFLLTFLQYSNAQSIERSVMASAGGQGQSSTAQITWTAGESIISTLQSSNNLLTQGFQQLYINNTTSVHTVSVNQIPVSVFPIPCVDYLDIKTIIPINKSLHYNLLNELGAVVSSEKINESATHIDMARFEAGEYFLFITDENNQLIKSFNVIKSK